MPIRYLSGVNVDANTLFVDSANDRVGIGTGSPSYKLQVNGNAAFATNSGGLRIDSYDGDTAVIRPTVANGSILISDDSGTLDRGVEFLNGGGVVIKSLNTFDPLNVQSNGSSVLLVKSSGNVGIGTTNPNALLEISGNAGADPGPITNPITFRITDAGNAATGAGDTTNPWGRIQFYSEDQSSGGPSVQAQIASIYGNIYSSSSHLAFYTQALPTTGIVERMRILDTGGVSIGTSSATGLFNVEGISYFADDIILRDGSVSSGDTLVRIYDSSDDGVIDVYQNNSVAARINGNGASYFNGGNVGIGTTSPQLPLHINSNYPQLRLQSTNDNTYTDIGSGTAFCVFNIVNPETNTYQFRNAGSAQMTLTTSDNVLIGTTTDSGNGKLQVVGGIEVRDSDPVIRLTPNSGTYAFFQKLQTSNGNYLRVYDGTAYSMVWNAGNVGIGTTAPSANLEVAKGGEGLYLKVGGDNAANGRALEFSSSSNNGSVGALHTINATSGNGAISLNTAGVSRLFLDRLGNVGIGTTSPQVELHVKGNNGWGEVRVEGQTFASGHGGSLEFYSEGTALADVYANTSKDLILRTNGSTERMRITSAGNVGIGTTSPVYKLDVVGSQRIVHSSSVAGLEVYTDGSAVPNALQVRIGRDNGQYFGVLVDDGTARLIHRQDEVGSGSHYFDYEIWSNITNKIYQWKLADNAGAGQSTLMVLNSTGLGIGTTSPSQKLDVVGTARVQGNLQLSGQATGYETSFNGSSIYSAASTFNGEGSMFGALILQSRADSGRPIVLVTGTTPTERMRITDTGNVGIGTTSPSQKLHVVGNTTITGVTYTDIVQTYSGASIDFRHQDASVVMRVDTANARVGIGTTSPSYKLDVSGDIRSTTINLDTQGVNVSSYGFLSQTLSGQMTFLGHNVRASSTVNNTALVVNGGWISSLIKQYYNEGITFHTSTTEYSAGATYPLADTERMRITSTGNVGIGTTSPAYKLDVDGSARVTGAYYDSNNSAGSSGQVLSSTGSGTDWVSLSEISGVDGTGTANYVAKWSDADTIANSQIRDDGTTVGIGLAPSTAKLTVAGSIEAGGKTMYTKVYGSIDTTGQAVAGISASSNGQSALFQFTCNGGSGEYQKIIYACHNASGTWYTRKVVDEGTNALDVVASANGATITFTFKGRTASQSYSPRVLVEITGTRDASYL